MWRPGCWLYSSFCCSHPIDSIQTRQIRTPEETKKKYSWNITKIDIQIVLYNYWMISRYTLNNILREFAISTERPYSIIVLSHRLLKERCTEREGKGDRVMKRSGDSGFELLWLGDNKVLKYHVVILKLSTNYTLLFAIIINLHFIEKLLKQDK